MEHHDSIVLQKDGEGSEIRSVAGESGEECFPAIRQAVLEKNVDALQKILDIPSSFSSLDMEESTLLKTSKLLSTLDSEGLTVMHQAIFTKSVPILSALLEAGADVNARDEEGCTLLHTAAMVGNCLIAGWLLKEGANPTSTDAEGLLPIDRTEDCGMEDLLLSAMSLAGYAQHRAAFSCDLSEADDSDYCTGTSSLGSFSEDDDGVLSLVSCTWEEEDADKEDVDQERCQVDVLGATESAVSPECPPHTQHYFGKWHINPAATSAVATAAAATGTGTAATVDRSAVMTHGDVSTGDLSSTSHNNIPHQQVPESHPAQRHESEDVGELEACESQDRLSPELPSTQSLADGVRMWQRLSSQSCDEESLTSQPFHTTRLPHPQCTTVHSKLLTVAECRFSHMISPEEDIHQWSEIHRHAIFTGFHIVSKSHSDTLDRVKSARATSSPENQSAQRGVTRGQTVSESDFGWVLPRGKSAHRSSLRSILRHGSLNDGATRDPEARCRPLFAGTRRVVFVSHVVFQDAVRHGNAEEVRNLVVSSRIGVNSPLPSGLLPLHLAVLNRQRAVVQLLLVSGAEVDGRDIDNWTPLHAAALEGTVPIANLLLEYQADPMAATDDGRTPLMLASNENVRLVLQNAGREAMSKATKLRQAKQESANLLDDDDVDETELSDISDDDGDATSSGEESDTEDDDAPCLAAVSAAAGFEGAAEESDDEPADVLRDPVEAALLLPANPTDEEKATACGLSDLSEQLESTLLDEDAEPAVASSSATKSRSVRFSPNVLLRHAILNGGVTEVRCLLDDFDAADLGLNVAELSGVTAVHQAVLEEAADILTLLLQDGRSDVNAKDADGWTPLHAAAAVGNLAVTRLLLGHGASATVLSDDGKFPIELADNVELEGALRQAMQTDS